MMETEIGNCGSKSIIAVSPNTIHTFAIIVNEQRVYGSRWEKSCLKLLDLL